jgi:hypothetical protein
MKMAKKNYHHGSEGRREIQNPQMLETDPKSFIPAIYFSY